MSPIDRAVLAERALSLERHLARVAEKLPPSADGFVASSDASDAVVLHLWQAAGLIDAALADRLVRAAGFRNLVAHAYERLDMTRVHQAARMGPADLRALVAAIARAAP
ncbi:MAG: DUF86 domain-containing protein [Acidobacteria bacterium]|nr:DUF86 domain-containing protein [Acidobacteriota bacterium]